MKVKRAGDRIALRRLGRPAEKRKSHRLPPILFETPAETLAMDPFTPQALFDLYSMLPNEGKTAFLKMVGRISTAHAPFMIVNELPALEKYRFSELVFQPLTSQLFPILEREARRIARDNPGMPDNEFDKQLHESVKGLVEKYSAEIAEVERASLKGLCNISPR